MNKIGVKYSESNAAIKQINKSNSPIRLIKYWLYDSK